MPWPIFAVVLLLRGAGKRALAKMRAYDFVVTVALRPSLATAPLSSPVKLDKAVVGVALLLGPRRLFAWLSTRSHRFHDPVNDEPPLVFHRGRMLTGAIESLNLTPDEIMAAARSQAQGNLDEIEAVVVETDGASASCLVYSIGIVERAGCGHPVHRERR